MKKAVHYILSLIIALLSLILTAGQSEHLRYLLLFFALIIITCTFESISDDDSIVLPITELLLCTGFSITSGGFLGFISLMLTRREKQRWLWSLIPSAVYLPAGLFVFEENPPLVIVHVIMLGLICLAILLLELLATEFIKTKLRIKTASTASAISEMNEKKKNRELSMQSFLAQKTARLEERENISRNIHNSVGHSITAAIMTLDAADMLFEVSPDKAREKLGVANERIRESLSSIRRAVRVLDNENKSVSLYDLSEMLRTICDSFVMDTTITALQNYDGCDLALEIPSEHTEFLCGALSELLTNGVRHGNADSFVVTLISDSRHLQLSVSDNGKSDFSNLNGKRRIENGFGLKKLISYCERCGGDALFTNDNGFRSVISLPILKEDNDEQA